MTTFVRFGKELIQKDLYEQLALGYNSSGGVLLKLFLYSIAGAFAGGFLGNALGVAPEYTPFFITVPFAIVAIVYAVVCSRPRLSVDEIQELLSSFDLDRGTQAYVDALIAIGENEYVDEDTAAQIAREMKSLLDTYYQLAAHRDELLEAMGTASESERDALRQQMAEVNDPEARAALQESLHLLEQRLANRQVVGAYVQRIEAHLELIVQTMKSLRDALSRLRVAPERVGEFDVEQLRQRLLELQQEAAAVENAAQEVITHTTL